MLLQKRWVKGSEDESRDDHGRWTAGGASSGTEYRMSSIAGNVVDLANKAVVASADLSDDQKKFYYSEIRETIGRMNDNCVKRIGDNVDSYRFFPSNEALSAKMASEDPEIAAMIAKNPRLIVEGGYDPSKNGMNFDGSGLDEHGTHPPRDTYSHEYYHAVDAGGKFSNDHQWLDAGNAELTKGQLTSYARTNTAEGFAEFGRYLCSDAMSKKANRNAAEKKFPLCFAFFKDNDLLPKVFQKKSKAADDSEVAEAPAMRDIFTDAIVTDNGMYDAYDPQSAGRQIASSWKQSRWFRKDFDESLHPRDDRGRFGEGGSNANERPLSREEIEKVTERPEFKAWFGLSSSPDSSKVVNEKGRPQDTGNIKASKVLDEEGLPIVEFHGTGQPWAVGDKSKLNTADLYGPGFYFTSNMAMAHNFSHTENNVRRVVAEGINKLNPDERKAFSDTLATYFKRSYAGPPGEKALVLGEIDKWAAGEKDMDHLPGFLSAHYNTDILAAAKEGNVKWDESSLVVKQCFLNVRNPFYGDHQYDQHETASILKKVLGEEGAKEASAHLAGGDMVGGRDIFAAMLGSKNLHSIFGQMGPEKTELVSKLQKAGYDGVKDTCGSSVVWVAFEPTQVKDVHAKEFDPKSPNTLKHSVHCRWFRKDVGGSLVPNVPDIRQTDHFSCGAAWAEMVGKHFGVGPQGLIAWKHKLGTDVQKSTSPESLVGYLRELGLDVQEKYDATIDDIAEFTARNFICGTPIQAYMSVRSPEAAWDYGHWEGPIGVIGAAPNRMVICQDSSSDNAHGVPGGDVPKSEAKDTGDLAAPGKILVTESDFDRRWHDVGEPQDGKPGKKYDHYLIAVGMPDPAVGVAEKHSRWIVTKEFTEEHHPRDVHGRWTSVAMVSPYQEEGSLALREATEKLHGARQKALMDEFAVIDANLGISGVRVASIGAWHDKDSNTHGAENSTEVEYAKGTKYDDAKLSAIMKGRLANQKQVLTFQAGGDNAHVLHEIHVSEMDASKIHQSLIDAGIPYHTLIPEAGGTKIVVVATDKDTDSNAKAFAEKQDGIHEFTIGHADFIPADPESRESSQRFYDGEIERLAGQRSDREDILRRWAQLRDHWFSNEVKRSGRWVIKAGNPNHDEAGRFASGDSKATLTITPVHPNPEKFPEFGPDGEPIEGHIAGLPITTRSRGVIDKLSKKTRAMLEDTFSKPEIMLAVKEAGIKNIRVEEKRGPGKPKEWTAAHTNGALIIHPRTAESIAKSPVEARKKGGLDRVIMHEAAHGRWHSLPSSEQDAFQKAVDAHPEVTAQVAKIVNIKPPRDAWDYDEKSRATSEVYAETAAMRHYDPDTFAKLPSDIRAAHEPKSKRVRWFIPKGNPDQPRGQPGNAGQFASAASGENKPESHIGRIDKDPKIQKAKEDALTKIGVIEQNAKDAPNDPAVKAAYGSMKTQIWKQYNDLLAKGYKFEFGPKDPYETSKDMRADVDARKTLVVYNESNDLPKDHPLAEIAPNGETYNSVFRGVHDYNGHYFPGNSFGPNGELGAYQAHSKMFTEDAFPALAAETLAQNAWVNFGPHHPEKLAPADRPFAPQKAYAFPMDLAKQMAKGEYASVARPTETPEFKAWFGKSKVVDADGSPKIVYHNTLSKEDFHEFEPRIRNKFDGTPSSKYGVVYFSGGEPRVYQQWAERTYPAYLSLQNPWDFRNSKDVDALTEHIAKNMPTGHNRDTVHASLAQGSWGFFENNGGIDFAKEHGHDGFIIQESPEHLTYAVFDAKQIKSAVGNSGKFDRQDPDIRKHSRWIKAGWVKANDNHDERGRFASGQNESAKTGDEWKRHHLAHLPTTDNFEDAGFIRPDAKLVDLERTTERAQSHAEAAGGEDNKDYAAIDEALDAGFIRLHPESNAMEMNTEPTDAQYNKIAELVDQEQDAGNRFQFECGGGPLDSHNMPTTAYFTIGKDDVNNAVDKIQAWYREGRKPYVSPLKHNTRWLKATDKPDPDDEDYRVKANDNHDERGRFASTDSNGKTDAQKSDGDKAKDKIHERETWIAKQRREHFLVFDAHGNEELHLRGTADKVDIPANVDLTGKVVTHNHPGRSGDAGTFSLEDVILACKSKCAEMRAVTKKNVFSIKPKDGGSWPKADDMLVEYRQFYRDAMNNPFTQTTGPTADSHHWFWGGVADKLGLEYHKYKRNDYAAS